MASHIRAPARRASPRRWRSAAVRILVFVLALAAGFSAAPAATDEPACVATQRLDSKGQEPGPYIPPVIPGIKATGTVRCGSDRARISVSVRVTPPIADEAARACDRCDRLTVSAESLAPWGFYVVEVAWTAMPGEGGSARGAWLFGPGFTVPLAEV